MYKRQLRADAAERGIPFQLACLSEPRRQELEGWFPGCFAYGEDRDGYDYLYDIGRLASLAGKKLHGKRNHINKFNKKFAYEYIPITPELVPECLQLECKWYKANREDNDEEDLNDERRSIIYALNHYDELGLIGGAICVDHQIVAFTFGAPINHNTFGVHVEKANVNYEGAYAVINKEFASHLPEKYTYVNREEDLGIPGLRQAKLSYNPFILLEKSAAIKKPAK